MSKVFNPVDNSDPIFNLPLKRNGFYDEKTFHNFVKSCESVIRKSIEYKEWRKYVVDTLGNDFCVFTKESNSEVTIEVHHHPFTLYDIVKVVIDSKIKNKKNFTSLDICEQVLDLHYQNKIGYIPLVRTLHEKYHNGYLNIPSNFILGNWEYLIHSKKYEISDELKQKIESIKSSDRENVEFDYNWNKNSYPGINKSSPNIEQNSLTNAQQTLMNTF